MHTKRQYLYMLRVMCIVFIALLTSCKTYPVQSCWDRVTHRVNGDRLTCVSYESRVGKLVVPTDETCMVWSLPPGTYLFSVQALDCEGLESGFTEPVEFETKAEG